MKILILVMYLASGITSYENCEQVGNGLKNCQEVQDIIYSQAVTVNSADEAAVLFWRKTHEGYSGDVPRLVCDDCRAKLYELSIKTGELVEIPIPEINFKASESKPIKITDCGCCSPGSKCLQDCSPDCERYGILDALDPKTGKTLRNWWKTHPKK
jgi:hypothetical protein